MGEGDTVMSYRGPRPPDAAHHYYFLLYEQSHVINTNQTANYTNPPNSRYLKENVNIIRLNCPNAYTYVTLDIASDFPA